MSVVTGHVCDIDEAAKAVMAEIKHKHPDN